MEHIFNVTLNVKSRIKGCFKQIGILASNENYLKENGNGEYLDNPCGNCNKQHFGNILVAT